MNLRFEELETAEIQPGLSRKSWEGDYNLEGEMIPLELILTEYSGDNLHDQYFSIDIKQGTRKFFGDEFTSMEEALEDADNRICDLYNADELTNDSVGDY